MSAIPSTQSNRLGWTLSAVSGVLLFGAFTAWGGIPTDERAGIFWAQMGVLFLATCAFVALFWHLMLRPLAPNLRVPKADSLPVKLRQRIGLIQVGGLFAIVVGGMWDELWHRTYGIPFGEDFFWRPHLLMYFGFVTFIALGFWGLHYLSSRLKGSFQQRFCANPIVGLFVLNAAFMLYGLASDPFWHLTFGEDLAAWSVPHLILLTSYLLSLLVAAFVNLSTLPLGRWRTILRLNFADALPILLFAAGLLLWLQIALIDWDQTRSGIQLEWLGLFRPEWLLAGNLLASVTMLGVLATRLLRCAGAATAVGLLALAIRFGMLQLLDAEVLHYVAWIAALLPLVAIDIYAYYRAVLRDEALDWRGTALVVIAAMLPNALVIRSLYPLKSTDNLSYGLAVLVVGIGVSWLSHRVADAMLSRRATKLEDSSQAIFLKPALTFGVLGAFVAFFIIFIATAAPPV